MDFSAIATGLSTATAVTAIIGMGAVMIAPNFAKWATKKIAGFFG